MKSGEILPIAQLWLSLRFSKNDFPTSFEVLMQSRKAYARLVFFLCSLLCSLMCSSLVVWPQALPAQTGEPLRDLLSVRPTDRVVASVAEGPRVVLSGQRHPLARPEYSIGEAAPDLYMARMVLVLRGDAVQDAVLEELLRAQYDAGSAYYHRWLTPVEFGKRFGVSQHDLDRITKWLQGYGFEVEEIPLSHRAIVFSGTAEQVKAAFQTSIRRYRVNDALHYANASDPATPQALAAVVRGVVALHDFRSTPMHVVAPQYTAANGAHFLMPQDWATIYDVGPLYAPGLDGTGQSIAALGRVDVALSDVRTFRTNAGLPPNDPQMIVNGPDPGFPWCDDELESAMDVEWAGAIADNATIKFVTSKSGTSDGITLSAQYAVNHNVAPVVSLSYGLCEAALGSAGNAFWNSTWSQAAAQGMSVFVSSGDGGAAGCDSPSETTATQGRGVNGLCSSPYSTCVGGTQFNDTYNPGQYWSATNGTGQSSALSYIPESAWNESGWSGGLWAGGGGASIIYSKPGWQAAPGVPADGKRDVPDVSMHASIQDAYVVQVQGSIFYASGTSAAAPSLASVMALVNEQSGAAQGSANPGLYALANQQLSANGAAVFHDVTSGNNSVPGVTGFNAGTGYDEATGLGSVDASLLVHHWGNSSTSSFTLAPNVSSVSMAAGTATQITLSTVGEGGFSSPVTLSASGAPTGITVTFSSPTISAGAPVTATITAAATAAAKSSILTISGTGGGLKQTAAIALTVTPPTFSLMLSTTSVTLADGYSVAIRLSTVVGKGFQSAVAFSISGLPAGVTASFAPASVASPGSGSTTLTVKAASGAATGGFTLTVKASGGGTTQTQAIGLTVINPTFALTATSASATLTSGKSTTFTLNTSAENGFAAAIALTASGLPKGVTAKFAPASIASPGNGSSTLTLTAAATTLGGVYSPTVTGSGENVTKTQTLSLTVIAPSFTLTAGGTKVIVARGGSTPITVTTATVNGFTAAVTLSVSGLPKGVTASFAPTNIASPGNGSSTLTLKAASTAIRGSSTLTVTAAGGGLTKTQSLGLTVQ